MSTPPDLRVRDEQLCLNLLLIEDNADDVFLLREYLREVPGMEFNIIVVDRLSAGISILRSEAVDVVLLDLGLPDGDGLDVLLRLRSEVETVPVIVLTDLNDERASLEVVKAGAQDYLVKGRFVEDELVRVIRYAIERQRLTTQLQQSEKRVRHIIENNLDGMLVIDEETKIRFANPASLRLLGRTHEELIGSDYGWPCIADQKTEIYVTAPNATAGVLEMSTSTLEWTGRPAMLISLHNITERKQAEVERQRLVNQVQQQAQQLVQILATVSTGVILFNSEGRVLQANPVARDELAVFKGLEVGDVLSAVGNRALQTFFDTPESGANWHELELDNRTYQLTIRPVEVGVEPEHWVLACNDVTTDREIRKQLQQQEQLAAVGQLAAGIAHDFNNILAVIVLYTQLMYQSPELSPQSRKRLSVIDAQAQSAAHLIEQILDFGRRSVLSRRPMDLLPAFKEHVQLLKHTLPETIDISLVHDNGSYTVNADATRMQQLLTNLAVNARDAMPEGGEFTIKLATMMIGNGNSPLMPKMQPGAWVHLQVRDTGCGISQENLPYIFQPFFTTKQPGKGSGLGLAQVHGIVGQHGGRIGVESSVGAGTVFDIYLPAVASPAISQSPISQEEQPGGNGKTVLVVEDNQMLRQALADCLEQMDYHVMTADDGVQALDVLEHTSDIRAVLTDLVMPRMGGRALLAAMRERHIDVPLIMLSGHPLDSEVFDLRGPGLFGWLTKPPDIDQLMQLLADAVNVRDKQV